MGQNITTRPSPVAMRRSLPRPPPRVESIAWRGRRRSRAQVSSSVGLSDTIANNKKKRSPTDDLVLFNIRYDNTDGGVRNKYRFIPRSCIDHTHTRAELDWWAAHRASFISIKPLAGECRRFFSPFLGCAICGKVIERAGPFPLPTTTIDTKKNNRIRPYSIYRAASLYIYI